MLLLGLQLLLLGAVVASAASCPTEGCPAEVNTVCGSDGLTYMNECLAKCQGAEVLSASSCAGAATVDKHINSTIHIPAGLFYQAATGGSAETSEASMLPHAVISAYHAEGLKMVGVLARSSFLPSMPALTHSAVQARPADPATSTVMMVNTRGHLYAAPPGTHLLTASVTSGTGSSRQHAPADSPLATEGVAPTPNADTLHGSAAAESGPTDASLAAGTGGAGSTGLESPQSTLAVGHRKLQGIFGHDTRREIKSTPRYPLSAAGHLVFTTPGSDEQFQCSGTLVGTYAVLTAAHCVVSRTGQVQEDITFTAAETTANHDGLGSGKGVRVYFNSGFLGSAKEWTNWDLGIVVLDTPLGVESEEAFAQELERIKAKTTAKWSRGPSRRSKRRVTPGTVGYAASPTLENTALMSAGYPGDKPLGSAWLMQCELTDTQPNSNVVPNKCPVSNGQSGASLIETRSSGGHSRHYVRGVVSFELCHSVCDGACCAGKAAYNGVLKITPYFQSFIDSHRAIRPYGEEGLLS